ILLLLVVFDLASTMAMFVRFNMPRLSIELSIAPRTLNNAGFGMGRKRHEKGLTLIREYNRDGLKVAKSRIPSEEYSTIWDILDGSEISGRVTNPAKDMT